MSRSIRERVLHALLLAFITAGVFLYGFTRPPDIQFPKHNVAREILSP